MNECPPAMSRGLMAIVSAVAATPPPWGWQQGSTFRAMSEEMDGYFEARKKQGATLYRLFCLLERDPVRGLERPTITVITGMWKPDETAFRQQDYDRVRALGQEYRRRVPRSFAPA